MPTRALHHLAKRLDDVDRLLEAHQALSRFRRIETVAIGATNIVRALEIAQSAFAGPLRGRRWGMDALNRAGIVLLTAHLEGYLEDLFKEAAEAVVNARFDTQYYDLQSFAGQAITRFHNPSPQNVKELFMRLGIRDLLDTVEWAGVPNGEVRKHLGDLVSLRNQIAHGEQPSVTRRRLQREIIFVRKLTKKLDKRLYEHLWNAADVRLW